MIKESFVIKAYYIPLEEHLKKIKNEYKISIDDLMEVIEDFDFNLPIQYRVSPESKSFGYIYDGDTDFYKVEWKIKKFIDWKSFLNKDLIMETE